MGNRESSQVPDPWPWIMAAAPANMRSALQEWHSWLGRLVKTGEQEWLMSSRRNALESLRSGRMVDLPAGPPPSKPFSPDAQAGWLTLMTLEAPERLTEKAWQDTIVPWSRELAVVLGLKGEWRHPSVDGATMATLLLMRLELMTGTPSWTSADLAADTSEKTVWKQCVRIRQYLADARPLYQDLPRAARGPFKLWWFGSLEWTRLAERKGSDLFREAVRMGAISRFQIRWQRWFGKHAFRG